MTEVRRWRDAEPDQFSAAVLAAAEQLGVLPLAVEKDFWACEALRAITVAHPGEVVFKGAIGCDIWFALPCAAVDRTPPLSITPAERVDTCR